MGIPSEKVYKEDRVKQLAQAINDAINGKDPVKANFETIISYCDELKRRLSQKKRSKN